MIVTRIDMYEVRPDEGYIFVSKDGDITSDCLYTANADTIKDNWDEVPIEEN